MASGEINQKNTHKINCKLDYMRMV